MLEQSTRCDHGRPIRQETPVRVAAAALLGALLAGACSDAPEHPPALGTLERDRIELVAEAREPIVEIAVTEGDRVERGQLIVQLDRRRLEAQLRQARARLSESSERLAELVAGPRSEEIRRIRSELEGARARLLDAEKELLRVEELVERGLQSESELDAARAERDSALAERDALRAELDELLKGTRVERVRQAEAELAAAEAARDELAVRVERLTVNAPVAGIVESLPWERGERPPRGATVAVLLDAQRVFARVYLPQPLRVEARPGDPAEISIPSTSTVLPGRVRWISNDAAFTPFFALNQKDRERLAYLAEIDVIDAADVDLPSGVPVEVRLADRGDDSPADD